jgi:ligand-binding sensor domain-containing protein
MAAGSKGLINRKGEATTEVADSVWSVESQDEHLFLGTSNGIQRFTPSSKELQRYSVSSWATDTELNDILPNEKGAFLAHKSGLSIIGKPHPKSATFKNKIKEEVIELIKDDDIIYAIGSQNLYTLSPNGTVKKNALRGKATSATWFLNRLWISTTEGIFSYQLETDLLDFVYDTSNITALASSPNSLWGVSDKGELIDIKPTKSFVFDKISSPLSIAPSGLALCLGTEDGVYRIWKGRAEQIEDILGTQDLDVAIYAVAADEKQGCWIAGEDGSIGRLDTKGYAAWLTLTDPELPKITKIIPQGDQAWILTEAGTWLVTLEK